MKPWTEKHMNQLLHGGKIRGYYVHKKQKGYSRDKGQVIPPPKPKGLIWLDWNLQYWCNERALSLRWEYKFCETRNYRSDYAIPALKILIEYEGGIFRERGAHNSPAAIQRDIEKYALAHKLGFAVIRVTAMNYTTVLKTLNEMVK